MPRTCTICNHPERHEIDAATLAGDSARKVAAKHRVSDDAVTRHRAHIPAALKQAQKAQELANADNLLDQLRNLHVKTLDILSKAEREGDLRVAVAAIAQARGNLELFAKLLGELSETTVNVLISPQWLELRAVILKAIEPFPQAQLALVEALENVRE